MGGPPDGTQLNYLYIYSIPYHILVRHHAIPEEAPHARN